MAHTMAPLCRSPPAHVALSLLPQETPAIALSSGLASQTTIVARAVTALRLISRDGPLALCRMSVDAHGRGTAERHARRAMQGVACKACHARRARLRTQLRQLCTLRACGHGRNLYLKAYSCLSAHEESP